MCLSTLAPPYPQSHAMREPHERGWVVLWTYGMVRGTVWFTCYFLHLGLLLKDIVHFQFTLCYPNTIVSGWYTKINQ